MHVDIHDMCCRRCPGKSSAECTSLHCSLRQELSEGGAERRNPNAIRWRDVINNRYPNWECMISCMHKHSVVGAVKVDV